MDHFNNTYLHLLFHLLNLEVFVVSLDELPEMLVEVLHHFDEGTRRTEEEFAGLKLLEDNWLALHGRACTRRIIHAIIAVLQLLVNELRNGDALPVQLGLALSLLVLQSMSLEYEVDFFLRLLKDTGEPAD